MNDPKPQPSLHFILLTTGGICLAIGGIFSLSSYQNDKRILEEKYQCLRHDVYELRMQQFPPNADHWLETNVARFMATNRVPFEVFIGTNLPIKACKIETPPRTNCVDSKLVSMVNQIDAMNRMVTEMNRQTVDNNNKLDRIIERLKTPFPIPFDTIIFHTNIFITNDILPPIQHQK